MTTLTQISETQAQKATSANENFAAVSPAGLFGRKAATTSGLTWGFYGGILYIDGVGTSVSDGAVALTASQTNYIEATRAGVVSANITGFTAGRIPLYTVVTGSATISSYTDYREHSQVFRRSFAYVDMGGSPSAISLTAAQARCDALELRGSASAGAALIVPQVPGKWFVYNNCGVDVTVTTNTGGSPTPADVSVSNGSILLVFSDGVNVRSISAGNYDPAAVAITGGTINGAAIGGSTPAAGAFTTLSATGLVDLSAAGAGQIKFPATQNSSADPNTFDDYEEGTWTPVLTFSTPGDLSVAYSAQVGTYTKIARLCTAMFNIVTSTFTHSTASGNTQINTLPFATANISGNKSTGTLSWQGITIAAGYTDLPTFVDENSSTVLVRVSGSGQTNGNLSTAGMPSGGSVILQGAITYPV